jgi:hypothetical protein
LPDKSDQTAEVADLPASSWSRRLGVTTVLAAAGKATKVDPKSKATMVPARNGVRDQAIDMVELAHHLRVAEMIPMRKQY